MVDCPAQHQCVKPFTPRSIMAIDPKLLEILACPLCKTEVRLTADGSGLRCAQCRRIYPIREDIPVMLVDQATLDESSPEEAG